jgi:hypothetical protein
VCIAMRACACCVCIHACAHIRNGTLAKVLYSQVYSRLMYVCAYTGTRVCVHIHVCAHSIRIIIAIVIISGDSLVNYWSIN